MLRAEPAAHHELRLAGTPRLRQQPAEAVVHTACGARGEEGVQSGQPAHRRAHGLPVGGVVDGAVEGPAGTGADRVDEPAYGRQVRRARAVEETQHELVGALAAQRRHGRAERVRLTGAAHGEVGAGPQHHPDRDVHRGPDGGEGLPGRRQAVRRHVGDQFEAVRAALAGREGVVGVERDHFENWSRHISRVSHAHAYPRPPVPHNDLHG